MWRILKLYTKGTTIRVFTFLTSSVNNCNLNLYVLKKRKIENYRKSVVCVCVCVCARACGIDR